MIKQFFYCDLCSDMATEPMGRDLIGLHWTASIAGWEQRPPRDVQRHICHKCLTSLKAIEPEAARDE